MRTDRVKRRASKPRTVLRAEEWVSDQRDAIRRREKQSGVQRPQLHLPAYTIYRAVKDTTPNGIFKRSDIMDFRASDHGAKVFSKMMLSLVTPTEGKIVTGARQDKSNNEQRRWEDTAGALPHSLHGFLFHAMAVGPRNNQKGPRRVGYSVNPALVHVAKHERQQLLAKVGHPSLPIHLYIPHVTLFETPDQQLAEDLKAKLENFVEQGTIPLDLGQAQAVPIRSDLRQMPQPVIKRDVPQLLFD